MSLVHRLRVLLLCVVLQAGVMLGAPMRPDEIREWMDRMNRPKLAHVLPSADRDGADDP